MKTLLIVLLIIPFLFGQSQYYSVFSDLSLSQKNKETIFNSKAELYDAETKSEYLKFNAFYSQYNFSFDFNLTTRSSGFDNSESSFNIRELFYQNEITENMEYFIGRKLYRHGVGYYKNPSAFLNAKKLAGDVDDRFKNSVGQDALGINYYFENSDLEVVYTPYYSNDDGIKIEGHGLFAKYYFLWASSDISLMANFHTEFKNQMGLSLANTMTDFLEVHTEVAFKQGSDLKHHALINAKTPFQLFHLDPYRLQKDDSYHTNFLIGTNLTTSFGLNIITEYTYESDKLAKSEWQRLMQYTQYLDELNVEPQSAVEGNKLWVANSLNKQQEYLFNRIAMNSETLNYSLISIHNLYDSSAIVIAEINRSFSNLFVLLQSTWYTGSKYSDYGNLFLSNTISISLSYKLN